MEAIRAALAKGTPFLGICLGEHLLFEGGTEHAEHGTMPGLGIIDGIAKRMPAQDSSGKAYKIPHVGWNSIQFTDGSNSSPLFAGIPNGEYFYFTHSYIAPEQCHHRYDHPFDHVPGCRAGRRSHLGSNSIPEKSSDAGARVLKNFVDLASRLE